jgi:hypothetical protein
MWLWSHIFEEMKGPKFHIFLNASLASSIHSSTNGVINGNPNVIGSFEQGVTTNPIHNHYNLQPLYLKSLNPKTNLRCSNMFPQVHLYILDLPKPIPTSPKAICYFSYTKPVFLEIKTTLKIHGMKTAASSHVHQSFQELSTWFVIQQYHPQVHGDATLQFQRLMAFWV